MACVIALSREADRDKNKSMKVQSTRWHGEGPSTEVLLKDTKVGRENMKQVGLGCLERLVIDLE